MHRKPLWVGGFYFVLLVLCFFAFTRWMASTGGRSVPSWRRGEKIAIVRIEGAILESEAIIEEIRQYRDDDAIRAILLRIDSPGGAVVPSQEIYEEVRKAREEKKVVASMGSVAASGGYYIAAATDRIIANPGTLTGSIGVILEMANFEELLQKVGVESMVIKSGKNKDVGSPFRKMSEEERALLQNVIDDVHAQFMDAVAAGRALDLAAVRALADGRIFTGRQAKAVGLVDDLGTLQDAIRKTAELAGIEGEPQVIESNEAYPFLNLIQERLWPDLRALRMPTVRLAYRLSL